MHLDAKVVNSLIVLTTLGLITDMNYSHLLFVRSSEFMTIWPEILQDLDSI